MHIAKKYCKEEEKYNEPEIDDAEFKLIQENIMKKKKKKKIK